MIEPSETQSPTLTKDGILFSRPGCQVRLRTRDDTLWARCNGRARWTQIDAPPEAVTTLRASIEALLFSQSRFRDRLSVLDR